MQTTRLSSKGQIIIPQSIRELHKWKPGIEFNVIDTEQGVLLIPRMPFKPTTVEEVLGCVKYKGKKKTLREMELGIEKGAKRNK